MDNTTIEHTIYIYESSLPYIGTICSYSPVKLKPPPIRARDAVEWHIGSLEETGASSTAVGVEEIESRPQTSPV